MRRGRQRENEPSWDYQARVARICRYPRAFLSSGGRVSPSRVAYHQANDRLASAIGGRMREKTERTLHDASMLCSVTHTEMTLRTGDHSLPRMDAQIYRHFCQHLVLGGPLQS